MSHISSSFFATSSHVLPNSSESTFYWLYERVENISQRSPSIMSFTGIVWDLKLTWSLPQRGNTSNQRYISSKVKKLTSSLYSKGIRAPIDPIEVTYNMHSGPSATGLHFCIHVTTSPTLKLHMFSILVFGVSCSHQNQVAVGSSSPFSSYPGGSQSTNIFSNKSEQTAVSWSSI